MSWFSELANKAEAMLVQLDQDAAQALQTDGSIRDTKILGQAINTISTYRDKLRTPTAQDKVQLDINGADLKTTTNNGITEELSSSSSNQSQDPSAEQKRAESQSLIPNDSYIEVENSISTKINSSETNDGPSAIIIDDNDSNNSNNNTPSPEKSVMRYSRKFTIQKSSLTSRAFATSRQYPDKRIVNQDQNNLDIYPQDINKNCLGADDIRASINRSLQECSIQSYSSPSVRQTSYASHFDDQPNLVDQSHHHDNDTASARLLTPPYFSLELPEERSSGTASGEIATRLLKQGALKKRSSFYLHQVISKLASSNRSSLIDSDKMKMRVRRAQLRLTSYARRMNYYFRTYPMIKYFILVYLALIQLLIVYVLFFYQSSSSSTTDLSSQIKQQETESKLISEIHPVAGNLHSTSLS